MDQPYALPLSGIAPLAEAPTNEMAASSPIHVLLVEDDPDSAELVAARLRDDMDNAFSVEWASNLVEAMIRLAQPGIDVILLDLGMPELSGYKSFRAVEAAAGRKLPVVILTADDSGVSKDLTLGFGACDYLLKQESSPARLKQALRNALQPVRDLREL